VGSNEADADNNFDAEAAKFIVVPFGDDEESSLWRVNSNPVMQEIRGDDDHEDFGIDGKEIWESGGEIVTTDGRGGGKTKVTTYPIKEAASRVAEHLNRQALALTHASTYAAIPMTDLSDTRGTERVIDRFALVRADDVGEGEEDVVLEVKDDVDEENGEYNIYGRHTKVGADPTAINIDDAKITSPTTIEVGRGTKDDEESMTTRNVAGGAGEDQDDEIAVMSSAGVVMNGFMITGESAGSERRKMHHVKGMVEEIALKEDVR
jgi:hypothetical protein